MGDVGAVPPRLTNSPALAPATYTGADDPAFGDIARKGGAGNGTGAKGSIHAPVRVRKDLIENPT